MTNEAFKKFIEENGSTWGDYLAFAKGWYDGLIAAGAKVDTFDPSEEMYKLKYTEALLGLH